MFTQSESDPKDVAEDETEEEKINRLIHSVKTIYYREEREKVQPPPSSRRTPVHLKMNAEGDDSEDKTTYNTTQTQMQKDQEETLDPVKCFTGDNTKEPDMDALDSIQGKSVQKVNVKQKPWRKPGADISDYFNYGFDEESWGAYCRKQLQIRAANRKLYTQIMVQMGHTTHEEKASCSAFPSSGSPSVRASRQLSSAIDVTEERPGPSSRMEECPHLSAEGGNNTQVVTEMFPKKDRIAPPHLSPPSNVISLLEVTAPPPFILQRPLLSPCATLDSGQSEGFDDHLTSSYPCSSGVPSLISGTMSSRAGVINTAKAWECLIWQDRCEREYRGRTRKRGCDKGKKKGRDTDKESRSLSPSSSRRRRDSGEDTQSRRKHMKAKRSRKDK